MIQVLQIKRSYSCRKNGMHYKKDKANLILEQHVWGCWTLLFNVTFVLKDAYALGMQIFHSIQIFS